MNKVFGKKRKHTKSTVKLRDKEGKKEKLVKKTFEDVEYENLVNFQMNLNIDRDLFLSNNIDGRKDIIQLEHYLHFIIIRLSNIKDLKDVFDFNVLFEYHKILNSSDFNEEKKDSFEKQFHYFTEFYAICLEFLSFFTDLSYEYNILEKDSFLYKKNIIETSDMIKSLSQPCFNFSTFYYISKFYENKLFHPSEELKEKNCILQHKFFILINKIYDFYPLPKDPNQLEIYYTNLIKNSKKSDSKLKISEDLMNKSKEEEVTKANFENKTSEKDKKDSQLSKLNTVQSSSYLRIFFCCCKPNKDVVINNKVDLIKLLTPLMTLNLSQNNININLHIIRSLLLDFTKAYLNIEESLIKQFSTTQVNEDKLLK